MKFVALPVGSGDAFYAETEDGFRILIDGGRSKRELPHLFERYTGWTDVHVLVCTHNDADHAEGLIGFLESGLRCEELWLPATWIDAVRSLPDEPSETMSFFLQKQEQLYKALEKGFVLEVEEGRDFQEIAWRSILPEVIEPRLLRENAQAQEASESRQALPLNAHLDERTIAALEVHLALFTDPWPRFWWWEYELWLRAYKRWRVSPPFVVAQDVQRLLKLAWLALNHGIPVRCFQHDSSNAGNNTVFPGCPLRPLSAKPSHYVRPRKPTKTAQAFFARAFLTTVNSESLVFFLDAEDGGPGVLFTADSDLKNVNIGHVPAWSVVTAPHHGSHDNRSVYALINKPMIWVRSDGYSKRRPCPEFLLAPGRRFCTLCRNSGKPKQAVRLYQRRGSWVRLRTRPCECR